MDGKTAVSKLKHVMERGMKYKLILMDISMPIMNGIEATKSIREYLSQELHLERN